MMYKFVKFLLVAYFLLIGFVLVGGFVAKQNSNKQPPKPETSTGTPANSTVKTFSMGEVNTHNNKSDCWIIVHNKVFDVTAFLNQHPGTPEMILPYCGKEASQAFETQGGRGEHSSSAQDMINEYYIGDLKQ